MKRAAIYIALYVAGMLSAPATAQAIDSSISAPLERIARSCERLALVLERLERHQ